MNKKVFDAVAKRSDGYCENCGKYYGKGLQKHHAFNGSRRKRMEMVETVFDLCYYCHEGGVGVHNNRQLDLKFKKKATQNLLDAGWTEEEIREKVGRWYLD